MCDWADRATVLSISNHTMPAYYALRDQQLLLSTSPSFVDEHTTCKSFSIRYKKEKKHKMWPAENSDLHKNSALCMFLFVIVVVVLSFDCWKCILYADESVVVLKIPDRERDTKNPIESTKKKTHQNERNGHRFLFRCD